MQIAAEGFFGNKNFNTNTEKRLSKRKSYSKINQSIFAEIFLHCTCPLASLNIDFEVSSITEWVKAMH